jgi:ABC-type antimicrobial peptide transport system permease subunit
MSLGVKTLRDAHAHIGSTVHLSITAIAGGGAPFTVVGTVVIPPNSDTARLGSGGVVTDDGIKRMIPPGFKNRPPHSDLAFRFAPGVNKARAMAKITKEFGNNYGIILPQRPTDLVNFGQVQNLPLFLAGLVGVLAAATLAHTLVTSIRRRRRDLAILKMLGFVPAQVRWAVAWQATTFVSVALLIGLPAGIAVGRVTWSAFASNLGTLPEPVTPSLRLLRCPR